MDEITLSEETIKTNEAKCLAAKREKEAVEAQLKASKKEEEARGSIKLLLKVCRDNAKSIYLYVGNILFIPHYFVLYPQEMRRKVEEMQRQLLERKNKLRATEDTAEKKGNVVDKVNKILNMKVREASFLIPSINICKSMCTNRRGGANTWRRRSSRRSCSHQP